MSSLITLIEKGILTLGPAAVVLRFTSVPEGTLGFGKRETGKD